jgi:flagellar M-ring protein FliF
MATTTATFQPGLAATPSASNELTTTANPLNPAAGGMALTASGPLEPIKRLINQPEIKKYVPLALIALAIGLFVLGFTWVNKPSYRAMGTNMSEADQQSAMEALRQGDFKPVLDPSSGQITVPVDRYHEARIYLASKGLPKASNTGIESLKEQSAMTTSQFMEQVRYVNAMEQELAKSITSIDSVQSARVHLALAKQSAFVRDRTPPKASVVVTPFPGRALSPSQMQAIVNLVAASVPLMTTDNVAILDNQGRLYTNASGDSSMGLNAAQSAHKQKTEELYRERISEILSPFVGSANLTSQVNIAMDFTQTEITAEDFDTRNKGPKTRSEALSEDKSLGKSPAEGVPGTLSNTAPQAPPAAPSATTAQTSSTDKDNTQSMTQRSTRNYEIDRMVRHTKAATGTIERVSVAVVVNERPPIPGEKNDKGEVAPSKPNPYSEEELKRMESLIKGVIGFKEDRGDVVTVVQAKFEPEKLPDLNTPWYKEDSIITTIKSSLVASMFLAFLFLVIKPAVMRSLGLLKTPEEIEAERLANLPPVLPDGELTPEEMNSIQIGEGETLEQIKAKLKPKKSSISMEMLDTANTYDDKVALVRMIVAEDTSRVASVLKGMIKSSM